MGWMMGYGGFGGFGGGVGMLFMGVVPLLLIGVVVWLVLDASRRDRYASSPALSPHMSVPDARSVLDERFARGEIDRQEYLQRRDDLGR